MMILWIVWFLLLKSAQVAQLCASPVCAVRAAGRALRLALSVRSGVWDTGFCELGKSVMKGSSSRQLSALENTAP